MSARGTWPPSAAPLGTELDVVGIGEAMLLLQAPPPDGIDSTEHLEVAVAGAELTVCATVTRVGGRAAFLSAVGADPAGRRVRRCLTDLGVSDALLTEDAARPTGVFLRETPASGERRVYYYRAGSAASALDVDAATRLAASLPRAVIVSGITAALGAGPRRLLDAVVRWAGETGTALVLDVNLRPALGIDDALAWMRKILPRVDLMVLGDDESGPLLNETDPARVLTAAAAAGVGETALKGAERGAWVVDGGAVRHLAAQAVDVVDPVGAGDAFLGGYLAGRLAGAGPYGSAGLGTALAAGVIGSTGDAAGLPSVRDARRLLERAIADIPPR